MTRLNLKLITALIAGLSGTAHAAGFALLEQNASGLGNAYAGQAASAQDASTIFFNPAGMTFLPEKQLVVVAHIIKPTTKFSGSSALSGGMGGDIGDYALVPNAYYAHKITPELFVGIGMNSPFGLKTEYDPTWLGRLQAIKSELKTVNLNPSVAWKASESLSLGAGISIQYAEATLTNATAAAPNPGPLGAVKGDDFSWGFNLGALWQISEATRIGIAYRSEVEHTLKGDFKVNGAVITKPISADLTLPDSASVSLVQKLDPRWDLLADVTWTGWSDFDRLRILRPDGSALSVVPENWDDSYRYSVGTNYRMSDQFTLRLGVAFDETPVSDAFRTARIPDEDRTWLAIGGQYRFSKQGAIDFGYTHLFIKDASLNSPAVGTAPPSPAVTGQYDGSVDILSVQYTRSF